MTTKYADNDPCNPQRYAALVPIREARGWLFQQMEALEWVSKHAPIAMKRSLATTELLLGPQGQQ